MTGVQQSVLPEPTFDLFDLCDDTTSPPWWTPPTWGAKNVRLEALRVQSPRRARSARTTDTPLSRASPVWSPQTRSGAYAILSPACRQAASARIQCTNASDHSLRVKNGFAIASPRKKVESNPWTTSDRLYAMHAEKMDRFQRARESRQRCEEELASMLAARTTCRRKGCIGEATGVRMYADVQARKRVQSERRARSEAIEQMRQQAATSVRSPVKTASPEMISSPKTSKRLYNEAAKRRARLELLRQRIEQKEHEDLQSNMWQRPETLNFDNESFWEGRLAKKSFEPGEAVEAGDIIEEKRRNRDRYQHRLYHDYAVREQQLAKKKAALSALDAQELPAVASVSKNLDDKEFKSSILRLHTGSVQEYVRYRLIEAATAYMLSPAGREQDDADENQERTWLRFFHMIESNSGEAISWDEFHFLCRDDLVIDEDEVADLELEKVFNAIAGSEDSISREALLEFLGMTWKDFKRKVARQQDALQSSPTQHRTSDDPEFKMRIERLYRGNAHEHVRNRLIQAATAFMLSPAGCGESAEEEDHQERPWQRFFQMLEPESSDGISWEEFYNLCRDDLVIEGHEATNAELEQVFTLIGPNDDHISKDALIGFLGMTQKEFQAKAAREQIDLQGPPTQHKKKDDPELRAIVERLYKGNPQDYVRSRLIEAATASMGSPTGDQVDEHDGDVERCWQSYFLSVQDGSTEHLSWEMFYVLCREGLAIDAINVTDAELEKFFSSMAGVNDHVSRQELVDLLSVTSAAMRAESMHAQRRQEVEDGRFMSDFAGPWVWRRPEELKHSRPSGVTYWRQRFAEKLPPDHEEDVSPIEEEVIRDQRLLTKWLYEDSVVRKKRQAHAIGDNSYFQAMMDVSRTKVREAAIRIASEAGSEWSMVFDGAPADITYDVLRDLLRATLAMTVEEISDFEIKQLFQALDAYNCGAVTSQDVVDFLNMPDTSLKYRGPALHGGPWSPPGKASCKSLSRTQAASGDAVQ